MFKYSLLVILIATQFLSACDKKKKEEPRFIDTPAYPFYYRDPNDPDNVYVPKQEGRGTPVPQRIIPHGYDNDDDYFYDTDYYGY